MTDDSSVSGTPIQTEATTPPPARRKPVVRVRKATTARKKAETSEESAPPSSSDARTPAEETAPVQTPAPAPAPVDAENPPSPARNNEGEWPEAEESTSPQNTPGEGGNKRKRRRRKGKGSSNNAQAAEEETHPLAADTSSPPPPQRRKIDPEHLAKRAWKIYLAEVSEEGVALISDGDAKELSRRCFRLAEIFLDEQSRRI